MMGATALAYGHGATALHHEAQRKVGCLFEPQTSKRILLELCKRAPQQGPMPEWMAGLLPPIARRRPDVMYSTIPVAFDGAGNFPAALPELFALGQSDNDPTFGLITRCFTNMKRGGARPNDQAFRAFKLGITPWWHTIPAAATANDQAQAMSLIQGVIAASLRVGDQTVQQLGPIVHYPGILPVPRTSGRGVAGALGAPVNTVAQIVANQGWQAVRPMTPGMTFPAGVSVGMPLNILAPLPTIANLANGVIAITAVYYGISETAIQG